MEDQVADIGLTVSYVLLGLAILGVVFAAIRSLIINPKGAIMALVFIGAFLLIFLVGYTLASDEVTPKFRSMGADEGISKMVGAFLNVMWIFLSLGVLGVAFAQVKSLFK